MIKELYNILKEMGVLQEDIAHFIDEFIIRDDVFQENYVQEVKEADERREEDERRLRAESDELQRKGVANVATAREYDGIEQESIFMHQTQIKGAFKHTQRERIGMFSKILNEAISKIGNAYKDGGLPSQCFEKDYRLVVFDVDGTLLDSTRGEWFTHVWKTLDSAFETEKENQEFEHEYRESKITYSQWVDKILSLYVERGADKEKLYHATEHLKPVEGAMETLLELRKRGKKLAVLSGSLSFVLDRHFPRDLFSQVEINEIFFDGNGKISGWKATPYGDGRGKAMRLIDICNQEALTIRDFSPTLDSTVFVGDAGNDVYAVRMAGLGIAFYPQQMLEFYSDIMVGFEYKAKQRKKDLREILKYIKGN